MTTTPHGRHIHQGRNIKRFREMLGIKQEALAIDLGDDWTQKKVSLLEAKEEIEPELLERVAKIVGVPREAIERFDEETALQNIQNNYDNTTVHAGPNINYFCTFNPMDKMIELYERMLHQQELMIEKLERLLQQK